MRSGSSSRAQVVRFTDGVTVGGIEFQEVVTEEPLSIRLNDQLVATTMRTPGHDFELAVGLCFSDRMITTAPSTIRYCGSGAAVETEFNVVSLAAAQADPRPRLASIGSSCGLCGTELLATVTEGLTRLSPSVRCEVSKLASIEVHVRDRQRLFAATGGSHAAAVFDHEGDVKLVREDIGRHNAVDKVIGRLVLDGKIVRTHGASATKIPNPAGELGLWVSGRASLEILLKAWVAGFSTVVSVSAASALAIDTARRANIALYGFARSSQATAYQTST